MKDGERRYSYPSYPSYPFHVGFPYLEGRETLPLGAPPSHVKRTAQNKGGGKLYYLGAPSLMQTAPKQIVGFAQRHKD